MKMLLIMYKHDHITKEDYRATLRTHKAAIDAMKSSQRDAADEFFEQHVLERLKSLDIQGDYRSSQSS